MSKKSVRNKSGIYKIVAICASVIASVTMTLPTITSAVGMIGTSRTSSAISGASATKASKSDARSAGADSGRASAHSSTERSAGDNSYGIDADDIKIENADSWGELKGRNLEYALTNNFQVLHLKPKDSKNDVNGKLLIGNGSSDVNSIYYGYDGKATLINQIKIIVIDEDMTLSAAMQMFYGFGSVQKIIGLEHIKFSNKLERVNAYSMFSKCENLRTLDGIKNWDMTNVKNVHSMFEYCKKLKKIDLSGWKNAGIEDTIGMFRECSSLEEVDIFPSTEGKLKTIEEMFFNCHKLSSIPGIEEWNTNNINDMYCAFYMTALKSLDLSKWFIPTAKVPKNPDYYSLPSENEPGYLGVVLNNTLRDLTYVGNFFPRRASGVWRKSTGKSAQNPGENIELNHKTRTNYMRIVRDYIEVKFENKTDNTSLTCVADVLQGKDAKHNLSNTKFTNCKYEYSPSNDTSLTAADKLENAREMLSAYAENSGLTYIAKLIRNSKKSSVDALKNLLKEADTSRSKPVMNLDTIRKSLGIVSDDTVTWNVDESKLGNYIKEVIDRNHTGTGVYYLVSDSEGAKEVTINNGSGVPDSKISNHELVAWKDVTFTADVKHKPKPKPPVPPTPPTPPTPEPQPQPQPGPSPTPSPAPTPTPNPDDHGVLPDVTPKPDLNINPDSNPFNPLDNEPDNAPQNAPQNPLQSNQGADVENNALRRGVANRNRNNLTNNANFGAQKQLNGNGETCKCVCPTSPSDANSHKSNKSTRKSENKATPCKSGNYSWLWNGGLIAGLIISWLIMLLIGFVLGYKMRKKRDEKQIVEE
ncbi:BspA family leucine-rich repeat surface protein [Gardnerella sp. Marseille-QA0894]|uniref:BspA family leucine-rich repeat surface protein n=1 Tax=Gardnerella sp. Marseille-QA0894 TaxID=3383031 RepID=UPI003AF5EB99